MTKICTVKEAYEYGLACSTLEFGHNADNYELRATNDGGIAIVEKV